jgi:hypothetical protein
MTKLTNPGAVTRAPALQVRRPVRGVDPVLGEFVGHVLAEKLPVVAIGVDVSNCLVSRRIPLRALLLIAALAL